MVCHISTKILGASVSTRSIPEIKVHVCGLVRVYTPINLSLAERYRELCLVDSRGVCSTCFATLPRLSSTPRPCVSMLVRRVPLCISRYMHASIEAYRRRYSPSFAVDNIGTDKGAQACSPKGSSSPANENASRIQREAELRPVHPLRVVRERNESRFDQPTTIRYSRFNWERELEEGGVYSCRNLILARIIQFLLTLSIDRIVLTFEALVLD